jgi:hypothetical protein
MAATLKEAIKEGMHGGPEEIADSVYRSVVTYFMDASAKLIVEIDLEGRDSDDVINFIKQITSPGEEDGPRRTEL